MNQYWFWVLGSMVFYAIGEWASKKWSLNPGWSRYLFLLFAGYIANVVCWLPALKDHGSLAILGTIYAALYVVVTILLGYFVFSEPITVKQWVGIGLAIVAVTLLS